MLPVKVDGTEKFWQEFKHCSSGDICGTNHEVLSSKFNEENDPEDSVVEECFENVVLVFVYNSAVNHINNVHQHESVEAHDFSSQLVCGYFCLSYLTLFISNFNYFIFLVLHDII